MQIFHGKVLARSQSPGYIAGFQYFVIGCLDGIETLAGFAQSVNIDADAVCGVVRFEPLVDVGCDAIGKLEVVA